MLRKTFLAVGLAALLAIPVGVALANDVPAEVAEVDQPVGDQDQLQTQDQLRVRDPDVCGNCQTSDSDDASATEPTVAQDRDQKQVRDRDRDCVLEDPNLELAQARERTREQAHIQDSEQPRAQNGGVGAGPQGPGSGEYGHRNGVDS